MFGTNTITGKKFFSNAPKDSLFVTSIFFTLQGEGPFAGQAAVFVRLAKCNLDCSFCDTFFDDGDWMTYDEIDDRIAITIDSYWSDKGKTVPAWAYSAKDGSIKFPDIVLVMTGGEPLLQDNISPFMQYQLSNFKEVQVESNGILNTEVPTGVTLVCSPKCMEKNGVAVKYYSPSKTILDRADCLKFVMSADAESPYNTVPQWAHDWKARTGKDIYCSPMNIYNSLPQTIKLMRAEKGTITMAERSTVDEVIDFWEPGVLNLKENELNHKYTAHYCMDHGFKLNLQMHLYAGLS
jgi:organic radical activating enzyme